MRQFDDLRSLSQLRDQLRPYWIDDLRSYANIGDSATTGATLTDISAAIAAHRLEADPHPTYLTATEADALFLTPSEVSGLYYSKASLDGGALDTRYYTKSESESRYVNVTGDAMTGQLTINPGSVMAPLILGANAQGQTVVGLKADLLNRTVTAGAGLSGAGALTADITVNLGTPSSLSSTSVNSASGTTHGHAIDSTIARSNIAISVSGLGLSGGGDLTANRTIALASSSAPGAAAAILASNASGQLTLPLFAASTSVTTPSLTASAALSITSAAGNISLDASTDIISIGPSNTLQSSNYASQATGWGVSYAGGADFRYLFVDEMHAKSFIADLEQALAGGQIIGKSVAMLYSAFTAPAAGATASLTVRDLPSATGMAAFQNGDLVRLRTFSRAGGSLTIADCWGTVTLDTTYGTSGFDSTTKTQRYIFTRSSGVIGAGNAPGGMAASTVVQADALALDYGVSGNGVYEVNSIDGTYGTNSPYARITSWTTHPATGTVVRTQMGNLKGLFAAGNEYGLFAGTGVTTSDQYLRLSNVTMTQNNLSSEYRSGGVLVATINPTSGISLQTFDATGGVISWGDQRVLSWAETVGAATPDGAFWTQRTSTKNEIYLQANQVSTRAGMIQLAAYGEAATGNFADTVYLTLSGAESAATRSSLNIRADDMEIDLGNGSANIGNLTLYSKQLLISDGSSSDDGTATNPSYSFLNDPDTGIYRSADNKLDFAVGGASRLSITTSSLSAFADSDAIATLGRAKIGYINSDEAVFAHFDHLSSTNYAVTQTALGRTLINAVSGQNIDFRLGNVIKALINATGFQVGAVAAPTKTLDVNGNAYINQSSTTLADATLKLNQADLSEEFIDFNSTVGAGNSIDTAALGTYYGKIRVAVNGTFKYMGLYNS